MSPVWIVLLLIGISVLYLAAFEVLMRLRYRARQRQVLRSFDASTAHYDWNIHKP